MEKDNEESTSRYKGISSWSIRRPISTLAITSAVIVLGILFSGRLAVDLMPQIDYPHIRVVVNYTGVTPEVIEEQVTRPLERNLSATENLTEIHGRASEGRSYIEMYFDFDTDIDIALQDASRQLERARTELPDGIDPPRIMKMDPSQSPVFELAISSQVRSPIEVRDWVDQRLLPQLSSIPGVGTIDLGGGKEREIQVVADPERLRSYGITIDHLSGVLAGRNVDVSVGNITSYEYDILARTETRFNSFRDVAGTLVPVADMNRTVRLSDIADVSDSNREQRLFAYLNRDESVQVSIMKQPMANTVEVIDNIQSRIDELTDSGFITADYDIEVIRDDSFFITSSIESVTTAAILGGLLAMNVILLFLGSIRRSLIVALMIPVAIIATFVLMNAGGLTLNIMSLGGLALGVGLLIDNAIVMIENIFRHQKDLGKDPKTAAHEGSREVLSAVVAGTMTNLAAVLPFLLITGLAALLFRELIFTIAFAIVASLLAAVTLVPALSAMFRESDSRKGLSGTRGIRAFNRGFDRLRDSYHSSLIKTVQKKWLFMIAVVVLLLGSIWLVRDLGTEFLPSVDDGRITFRFTLPVGTSIEPTNEVAEILRDTIEEMPYVDTQYMTVGGYFRGGQISVRGGMIDGVVQLVPHSERDGFRAEEWVSEFQAKVSELGLPFIQQRVRGPRIEGLQTSLVDADIAVGITGEDLDQLEDFARDAYSRLEGIEGIGSIQIGRDERIPQMLIRVDEERSSQFNITSEGVAGFLNGAIEGVVPTHYVEGGFEYPVRVLYSRDVTGTVEGIRQIPIMNEAGNTVQLGSLVSFEETTGPAHIERFNQIRVVWINTTVNLNQATVGEVGSRVRDAMQGFDLPDGYSLIYAGEQEAIEESSRSLQIAILLAIFFVFIVMSIQYEKLFSPLVIIASLPFALIGVALALWITGLSLSASVLLGIVFLIGIVVNNAILLVEFAEQYRKKENRNVIEAISEAGKVRFRPILMTTLTTIFGMLPLAIGIGEGYEILQPLAVTVIGGLIAGTFLTLLILPGMYVLIDDLRARIFD
ncbi:AcrB/AcrD/AcrF family protein [Rhodohalobacter sp. SW132]|uniref:efflux RND transporter permease subunit n=1 Tax=Rhodohalobacter sp. SW132 TaxID=2293433 RepID=UPI000E25B4D9|nr:efflux RND transporter permease subunit [Rhodohalobacter sp. SW132]REL33442.1 AcrB/AcrD/AcrF family protein [Rhodohalobacter sp. SW132]